MKYTSVTKDLSVQPTGNRDFANFSISQSYPISNGYSSYNSSTFTRLGLKPSTCTVYYTFNVASIPENATINSVTCTAKASSSLTSLWTASGNIGLATGTTVKGTTTSLINVSSPTIIVINPGVTWTATEVRDIALRIGAVAYSSADDFYIDFYGASLTINYTYEFLGYEITVESDNPFISVSPEYSCIETADTESIYSYFTGYSVSSNIGSTNYGEAIGKGIDTPDTTTNDYSNNRQSTAYIDYYFTFNSTPSEEFLSGTLLQVKGHVENPSQSTSCASMQLYVGDTPLGDPVEFTSTTDEILTIPTESLKASDLNNCFLRFTVGYYGGGISGALFTANLKYPILITNDEELEYKVIDNNRDIPSPTHPKDRNIHDTFFFSSYVAGESINGTNYMDAIGKGINTPDTTGNDYYQTSQGGSGSTYIDYYFDFNSIPQDAKIINTTLKIKGHAEDPSQTRHIARSQLYVNNVAVGEYSEFSSTTDQILTISTGELDREDLDNCFLRFTIGVYGGRISGASFSINYELAEIQYVYDLVDVHEDHYIYVVTSPDYKRTCVISRPVNKVLLTHVISTEGRFDNNYGYVVIDNVKYTSEVVTNVPNGGMISITVKANDSADNANCYIAFNGVKIYSQAGTYEIPVMNDLIIIFSRYQSGNPSRYYFYVNMYSRM